MLHQKYFLDRKNPTTYTEKSDIYSMGILMWEAYSHGSIPWSNIETDEDVIERVLNGNLLARPSNCSQPYWDIIIKTWCKSPNDRPTFQQLKDLLLEKYYHAGIYLLHALINIIVGGRVGNNINGSIR